MFINFKSNGLWTVEFISTVNRSGKGVLVFNDGRLLGGDEGYYYSGTYKIDGSQIQGTVNVIRFDPTSISVVGNIDQFALSFSGEINDYHLTAAAGVVNNPQYKIRIIGNKKEDM